MLTRIWRWATLPGWPWLRGVRPIVVWTFPLGCFTLAINIWQRDPVAVDSLFILACVAFSIILFDRANANFAQRGYYGNLIMGWVFTVLFTIVCFIHIFTWLFLVFGVLLAH